MMLWFYGSGEYFPWRNFNFPDVPSLCIDHHQTNEKYTDYLYLKYKYAATAEMLAEMFLLWG